MPIPVTLHTVPLPYRPDLALALENLPSEMPYCMLGTPSSAHTGRYSYFATNPSKTVIFDKSSAGDPFELLTRISQKYQLAPQTDHPNGLPAPFIGGWVGYLSYDLGRYIEELPNTVAHDLPVPLMRFDFYDTLMIWDHKLQTGSLIALEYATQLAPPDKRLDHLYQLCQSAPPNASPPGTTALGPDAILAEPIDQMARNITQDDYLNKVARAIEYIKAGDIFEVNLSQRFSCPYHAPPHRLYHYLTEHHPANYAAIIQTPHFALVSASPELFLAKRHGHITTRPIKGTIARSGKPAQDEANRLQLLRSEKDIAELNMIIDLERNDLGKICQIGSVSIPEKRSIELHPTLYHAVATITGHLNHEASLADILRATFPGGSITGAPKIRAMEIIDELEPNARSVYTGSIGWLGVNGDFDFNIAIRTIIITDQTAYIQTGGAIVVDSTPQGEYDETLTKAAALIHALKASP
ncbi:MAG: anthranilate synthase component I family protein [Phycisphaerae bacterium]|nr:anthranilate synthase component I family protein [Phycisphaerae bacterium]